MFHNRSDAGRQLATKLADYAQRSDVIVLARPRGGVPVGYEVARALQVPLDVFLIRKLGVPGQEELAMGAIASGGVRVLNQDDQHCWLLPCQSVPRKHAPDFARWPPPSGRRKEQQNFKRRQKPVEKVSGLLEAAERDGRDGRPGEFQAPLSIHGQRVGSPPSSRFGNESATGLRDSGIT